MKYRKKPVVIEAMQLSSDNISKILSWMDGLSVVAGGYDHNDMPFIVIKTLEGNMTANISDYVIKGIKEEFYPCKSDIFEASYELVNEN
jgi:hypothetical protein